LSAFSIAPVRAAQMSRTRKEAVMATFIGNRSIKWLAEEEKRGSNEAFQRTGPLASPRNPHWDRHLRSLHSWQ
jgi:hypothetical protein